MSLEQNKNNEAHSLATTEKSDQLVNDTTLENETYPFEETQDETSKRSPFKKLWWLLPLLGVILAIGGVSVVRLRNNAGEETVTTTETQTAPLSVRTTTAQREPIRAWRSSEGMVLAARFKHLAFDTEGEVTYIAQRGGGRTLREGDRVQKGELLARIDNREQAADVNSAQAGIVEAQKQKSAAAAEVAQAQTQVAQARSQVRQNQAQVEKARSALDLAQSELERYRMLYEEGAITANEFDSRQKTVRDARADLRAAQASVESAQEQVRSAQAQVQAAQQQLEASDSGITNARSRLTQAEVAAEGTRLYAPFDGVVAYLNIRENEYYTPQSVTSQIGGDYQGIVDRVPIVVIDPSQFEVTVELPTSNENQVQTGQTAVVSATDDANRGETLIENARARGEVFAVNPAVSPGRRSIQANVRIQRGGSNLQHGDRVSTWIAVNEDANAVVVPLSAIVFRNQQPYVFVVNPEENTVEQRAVELGIEGITQQEIASGVEAGETVVTVGQNRLVDGTPVKVTSANNGGQQ